MHGVAWVRISSNKPWHSWHCCLYHLRTLVGYSRSFWKEKMLSIYWEFFFSIAPTAFFSRNHCFKHRRLFSLVHLAYSIWLQIRSSFSQFLSPKNFKKCYEKRESFAVILGYFDLYWSYFVLHFNWTEFWPTDCVCSLFILYIYRYTYIHTTIAADAASNLRNNERSLRIENDILSIA